MRQVSVYECTSLPKALPCALKDQLILGCLRLLKSATLFVTSLQHCLLSFALSAQHIETATMPLRSRRSAALRAREAIAADSSDSMSLPRYRDSPSSSKPQVSFSGEPPSSPSKNDGTLRMTVKMPPNKLASVGRTGGTRGIAQKVTKPSGGTRGVAQPKARVSSRESFEGGEILKSKRKREVKKSYVVESESDEEEDDAEEDDEVEEEDAMDVDDDEDAEGEDDDEDMSGQPPPRPIIKANKPASTGKSIITAKPASARKEVRPVETKEMASDDSDEELSELGSDMEDETMMGMGEEDAEGDEEEVEVEEEDDEEDEDSDLDTPGGGSRASTPDLSKLTRRQRARLEEGGSGHLLALPDGMLAFLHEGFFE